VLATSQMVNARHVIGCHLTQETRVHLSLLTWRALSIGLYLNVQVAATVEVGAHERVLQPHDRVRYTLLAMSSMSLLTLVSCVKLNPMKWRVIATSSKSVFTLFSRVTLHHMTWRALFISPYLISTSKLMCSSSADPTALAKLAPPPSSSPSDV